MTRRLVRLAWVAMLALGSAVLVLPSVSSAAESTDVVDRGWWNRTNSEAVPITVPPPAAVGDESLYVAGTPEGATAVAALKIELADEQTNPVLTLTVEDGQNLTGAQILACQTGSGWTGTQNGVWEAKPLIDCPSGSVVGIVADDEATVTFPLGPLQFSDKINIVLVAGTDPDLPAGANGSAFQAVFEQPGAPAIATTGGEQPTPTTPPPPVDLPQTATPTPNGATFDSPPADDSFGDPGPTPTPVAPAPAVGDDEQGQAATAPILQEATVGNTLAAQPIDLHRNGRPYAIVLLLAAAAGAIWDARHRNQLSLSGDAEPELGGLGRFVKPRTGIPPSLT